MMTSRRRGVLLTIIAFAIGLPAATVAGDADDGERIINDCGVNSLYLLLRLRRADVDLAELRRALPDTKAQGLSMAEIDAASRRYGVPLRDRRIASSDVPIDRPVIALLKSGEAQGHFVVLEPVGNSGRKVLVLDFPRPARIIDYAELMKGDDWTGLVLSPITAPERLGPWLISGVGLLLATLGLARPRRRRGPSRGRAASIGGETAGG